MDHRMKINPSNPATTSHFSNRSKIPSQNSFALTVPQDLMLLDHGSKYVCSWSVLCSDELIFLWTFLISASIP